MTVKSYTSADAELWNGFLKGTRNGTFLFDRRFMDYHADRFTDASLLLLDGRRLRGLFPANWEADGRCVCSHRGLTYGGLLTPPDATATEVEAMLQALMRHYRTELGAERLIYKSIPYIYTTYPSEEDRYALFRAGAVLTARTLSAVVPLGEPLALRTLRRRGVKKALQNDLYIGHLTEGDTATLSAFWHILDEGLRTRHGIRPVHSVAELALLMERFPKEMRLFLVYHDREVVAGCLVFVTARVIHVQYIASNAFARRTGALDLLFHYLITEHYKGMRYLDFGISTEQGGRVLNEGLQFQKEGFGARAVCYDTYELRLDACSACRGGEHT